MKQHVIKSLAQEIPELSFEELSSLVEVPPSPDLGDFAFPCFQLAKSRKKSPAQIAVELAQKLSISDDFEKVEVKGPYLNFFLNGKSIAEKLLPQIKKEREKFGSSKSGKGKTIVIDLSSPNIAKPFGIGHLRSTIIGNSIGNICSFLGYKVIKVNYLGDWGTPFGKIIAGYQKWGDPKKLKETPIKHLYEIYVRAANDPEMEEKGRETFKRLEDGDKEIVKIWENFRKLSLKEFDKIYSLLNIEFDVISGESEYNNKMEPTIQKLKKAKLLEESEGAFVVNPEEYNLGVCLIQKSDGATLYATRDITAAIDRKEKFRFDRMFYEVGQEQKLHFKQFFKVLELLGYNWSKDLVHIDHGLYLDKDGKKFATRQGKTVFMEDILIETRDLARSEIQKREKELNEKELDDRALKIARAAIFYGDLRNHRSNDMTFDIDRFLSFEGNTGPYLLYTYARAQSILRKASSRKKTELSEISQKEKVLLLKLANFPGVISQSYESLAPNLIANYAYELAQIFNEFYHSSQVIGSEQEAFRLQLVETTAQVLKNSLNLLGIETIEKM